MKFSNLNIKKEIIEILDKNNLSNMTEVQQKAIPFILKNKKVIVNSPSGSGKTLAFVIPIINALDLESNTIQAIILTPTIELSKQIYNVMRIFSKELGFKVDTADRAFNYKDNKNYPKVLIGTPKKVWDLYQNYNLPITMINTMVLDEVDMIIDLGFLHEIENITKKTKDGLIIHSYSATIPVDLQNFIKKYIKGNVEKISLKETLEGNNVTHYYINIKEFSKIDYLVDQIDSGKFNPYMAIIFTHDKKQAEELYRRLLDKNRRNVVLISSDIERRQRINTIKRIESNEFQFIIATDVASRGIDIANLSYVVHLGIPYDLSYYVHRCGRTGRFMSKGESLLILNKQEMSDRKKIIEKYQIEFLEKKMTGLIGK